MSKITLLDLLCERHPEQPRESLYARIACGEVISERGRHRDPKEMVPSSFTFEFAKKRYVSRAGHKLESAVERWSIPVEGRIWLDAGASTGGFTDCLLQGGARGVHAVDVGHNQLAYSLRSDPRVFVYEKTNIKSLTRLEPRPAAAVADLSFRSLRGVLPKILGLTSEKWGVVLFKPQFELAFEIEQGRSASSDGIVRDPTVIGELLQSLEEALECEGVQIVSWFPSPVEGRRGNREQLLLVSLRDGAELPHALKASRERGAPM